MLVETVKSGNAVIRVHNDSYDGKREEEIRKIIEEYCRTVTSLLQQKKEK